MAAHSSALPAPEIPDAGASTSDALAALDSAAIASETTPAPSSAGSSSDAYTGAEGKPSNVTGGSDTPPKRGRGRPKGSKTRRAVDPSGFTEFREAGELRAQLARALNENAELRAAVERMATAEAERSNGGVTLSIAMLLDFLFNTLAGKLGAEWALPEVKRDAIAGGLAQSAAAHMGSEWMQRLMMHLPLITAVAGLGDHCLTAYLTTRSRAKLSRAVPGNVAA